MEVSDHYPVSLEIFAKHSNFKTDLSLRNISFIKSQLNSDTFRFTLSHQLQKTELEDELNTCFNSLPIVFSVGF